MNMNDQTIPVVRLEGDARARGAAHGEQRRDEIGQAIQIYLDVFGLPDAALRERADHFARVTRAWQPELATEIDAIAAGAGVPPHQIHALNARSELVPPAVPAPGECTAVFLSEHALLGQTWDWLQALEPLINVLDVRHPDGHRLLTLSEPGIVGKIGLSSAGLGVGLNFLRSPEPLDGVPVHALLRGLLDARSPSAAEDLIARAGNGRSAHVMLGMATGEGLGLEFTGSACHRLAPEGGVLVHTNHFLQTPIDPGPSRPNTHSRLEQARSRAASGPRDWNGLLGILGDCSHPEHPVSVSWRDMVGWSFGAMGTVCAVAMDLRDGVMQVRRGPDPTAPWQTFRLDDRHLQLASQP